MATATDKSECVRCGNVKSVILESVSMERILRAGNYPNLTEIKLFNFNKAIFARYFIEEYRDARFNNIHVLYLDDSLIGHICKEKITDLILISNENKIELTPARYTKDVYAIILTLFKNLKHLTIVLSSTNSYPSLSLYNLSPMTFSSSTLSKLCINVYSFDDCLALLDGRLKQLTRFTVQVDYISDEISTFYNMDDVPNLKCFSLTCYDGTRGYDILVTPLLRRMLNLEELTLYLYLLGGSTFISGTDLDNQILVNMPRLDKFSFYIASQNVVADPTICLSNSDIEQTFTNIKNRLMVCIIDYFACVKMICHVFSLPFKFDRLEHISNNIPNIQFNSSSFSFIKNLSICNITPPFWSFQDHHLLDTDWCSIVEYPHLISLDMEGAASHYVEHFLDQTKTYLPCLTQLKIDYDDLKMVTEKFTKDPTECNCAKIKRLIIIDFIIYPKVIYRYFPLLSR